jgi:hypothetical protein
MTPLPQCHKSQVTLLYEYQEGSQAELISLCLVDSQGFELLSRIATSIRGLHALSKLSGGCFTYSIRLRASIELNALVD